MKVSLELKQCPSVASFKERSKMDLLATCSTFPAVAFVLSV